MKFSTATSRTVRGQLRCNECRKAFLLKEGDWHDSGNQQIFLCNPCSKAKQERQPKQATSR